MVGSLGVRLLALFIFHSSMSLLEGPEMPAQSLLAGEATAHVFRTVNSAEIHRLAIFGLAMLHPRPVGHPSFVLLRLQLEGFARILLRLVVVVEMALHHLVVAVACLPASGPLTNIANVRLLVMPIPVINGVIFNAKAAIEVSRVAARLLWNSA